MASPDPTATGRLIENTTDRYPVLHLMGAMSGGSDTYITDIEAAGQRQLVNSDRLPVDCRGADADLLALGFTFGEPDPHDPLFRPATLPQGWRREGSDHAMWSYILDGNGRQRVAIFYKAAFYDRSAHMSLRTIHGELTHLIWGDDPSARPVIDDWTPREAWVEALTSYRDQALADAAGAESYHPEGAKQGREHAARCDMLLAELAVTP